MKRFFEVKNVSDSVKDVDTVSRRVKVAISEMGSKDLDNEVIDQNAYNKQREKLQRLSITGQWVFQALLTAENLIQATFAAWQL